MDVHESINVMINMYLQNTTLKRKCFLMCNVQTS